MTSTALQTFTAGNSELTPLLWSEPNAADFFHGIPERQRVLNRLVEHQIDVQKQAVIDIRNSNIQAATMISQEVEYQTSSLTDSFKENAEITVASIQKLENQLCGALFEIKWQVSLVNENLEKILYTLQHPRSTEAQELLLQAIRLYTNAKYEDAEEVLREALRLDRTDYEVLCNLSFIELHNNNPDKALDYLQNAFSLPDNLSKTAQANVLSATARIYFIQKKYSEAFKVAEQLLKIESTPKREYFASIYAFHANKTDKAKKLLLKSIEREHGLFAVAASDPDLKQFRTNVLGVLRDITDTHLNDYKKLKKSISNNLETMKKGVDDKSETYRKKIIAFYGKLQPPKHFGEIDRNKKTLSKIGNIIRAFNELPQFCLTLKDLSKSRKKTDASVNSINEGTNGKYIVKPVDMVIPSLSVILIMFFSKKIASQFFFTINIIIVIIVNVVIFSAMIKNRTEETDKKLSTTKDNLKDVSLNIRITEERIRDIYRIIDDTMRTG